MMETLLTIVSVGGLVAILLAINHWKWAAINRERQKRLEEGRPAPIDRLPKAARAPVLMLIVAGATALKLLWD